MLAWEGSFFVEKRQVTLDQSNMLSHASCEKMTAWYVQHKPSVLCRATLGTLGSSTVQSRQNQKELSHCLHNLWITHCSHGRWEEALLCSAQTHTLRYTPQHQFNYGQPSVAVYMWECDRRRRVEGSGTEGSRWSTNPLLLLGLIIFLHSLTNLPFLSFFLSPQNLPGIHFWYAR